MRQEKQRRSKKILAYRSFKYFLLFWSLCFALCAIFMAPRAQARIRTVATKSGQTAPSGHVTIMILDMSGSMAQNDERGIRCSAANAYIDLSGPNDRIGLIGLDNTDGLRGGPHGFQLANVWSQPAQVSNPQALQRLVAEKSQHCRAFGSTPTYDALNQALTMLLGIQASDNLAGSVILLTDGEPSPDTSAQINAVQAELAPQFRRNHWPIDTIALGNDSNQEFRSFLDDLSNATGGKAYDDARGVIPGAASPLNITSFFVDIFARQNDRTPGPSSDPTTLNDKSTSQPFILDNYEAFLDIIVVRDPRGLSVMPVTLTTSNGVTLPTTPPFPGTSFDASDPYFAFFSIKGPPQGIWYLNISGTGTFLFDSLITSRLKVSIVSPRLHSPILPLGQSLNIVATIKDQEQPVPGGQFSLSAMIEYAGAPKAGAGAFMQSIPLVRNGQSDQYQGQVFVPGNETPGSYTIAVSASEISDVAISSDIRAITLAQLPQPVIDHPAVDSIRWDALLQSICSSSFPSDPLV